MEAIFLSSLSGNDSHGIPLMIDVTDAGLVGVLVPYGHLNNHYTQAFDQTMPQAPAPTSIYFPWNYHCQLDRECTLPLEGTTSSIWHHLHLHQHIHRQLDLVSCPWEGCFHQMLWRNVARHVKEKHMIKCLNRCALLQFPLLLPDLRKCR
ncbi:hypothetical protein EDD16DRAFT_1659265 [Pisolithus croceorrhizus]|nr:hypothetical protein EDD16DRAFT_1659265 [Pisolithus croceorrhizus]